MNGKITKAVIPVAGLGTRFLPVTKVVPKELLPVVDKPAIHYVVQEALGAGLTDIILVNHPNKRLIEEYFNNDTAYDRLLSSKGKEELLRDVAEMNKKINVRTLYQTEQIGLGHAVLQAKEAVGDEWFMLILPDMLVDARPGCCEQMVDIWRRLNKALISAGHAPREMVSSYGIIGIDGPAGPRLHKVSHLVEKPAPEDAPGDLFIAGRYILPSSVFGFIQRSRPGRMGEIQITDALCELAGIEGLYAYEFEGVLHDVGDKQGYLKANMYYGGRNGIMT